MKKSLLILCSFFVLSIFVSAVVQANPVKSTLSRNMPMGNAVSGVRSRLGEEYVRSTTTYVSTWGRPSQNNMANPYTK